VSFGRPGLGREDKLVVCVEPGFEIVVALLAILKRGAVYVPLDPSYPALRVQTMLDDTKPALVLTHSDLARKLPFGGRRVLELDRTASQLLALSTENPNAPLEPQQTAYIYYTSGTTGVPKGVMATQATSRATSARRSGVTASSVRTSGPRWRASASASACSSCCRRSSPEARF